MDAKEQEMKDQIQVQEQKLDDLNKDLEETKEIQANLENELLYQQQIEIDLKNEVAK